MITSGAFWSHYLIEKGLKRILDVVIRQNRLACFSTTTTFNFRFHKNKFKQPQFKNFQAKWLTFDTLTTNRKRLVWRVIELFLSFQMSFSIPVTDDTLAHILTSGSHSIAFGSTPSLIFIFWQHFKAKPVFHFVQFG